MMVMLGCPPGFTKWKLDRGTRPDYGDLVERPRRLLKLLRFCCASSWIATGGALLVQIIRLCNDDDVHALNGSGGVITVTTTVGMSWFLSTTGE